MLAFKALLLYATLSFSAAVSADDSICSGNKAAFAANTGRVCLPVVEVPTASGTFYYKAQLQLIGGSNPLRFTLVSTTEIASPGFSNASFSTSSGVLTIPAVELPEAFGTNRYAVSLQLLPNTVQTEFQLSPNVAVVISPDYVEGKTWKPYVNLINYEKDALNNLGYAQVYTGLAVAVYDFGVKSVGAWDLKETADLGSGMQAGVYVNRDSNEVTLAFRGTEFCINFFSCSVKESLKDELADAELTQGHDSGQFDDAFKFAQQILNSYPGRKITVTGHSLGGGLAQAVGASFQLETYAFNSSPVPNNFFDAHSVKQFNDAYAKIIHVISDIHDPISTPNHLSKVYADASYVTPVVVFDFDKKAIAPSYETSLDSIRFNKHSMDTLRDNIATVMQIYKAGW
ncbi:MAG: lipase [Methylococcaceae bacterium]|nr:lipase [Methylococcaceae bacterium]